MEVGGVTYTLNDMKGQFHGTSTNSSVTGLYRGGTDDSSEITGAIIGTGTNN